MISDFRKYLPDKGVWMGYGQSSSSENSLFESGRPNLCSSFTSCASRRLLKLSGHLLVELIAEQIRVFQNPVNGSVFA